MILQIFIMIIGFILLIKGANLLVKGGSNIAKRYHISELVIGLTIVSIGTSLPELMVSLTSTLKGHFDISIGNVIGSNIANILLILGICATIKNLKFKKETKYIGFIFILITTILLIIFANNNLGGYANTISRAEGITLLILCIAFIIYNIILTKKTEEFDGISTQLVITNIKIASKRYLIKSILFIIFGIVCLKFGGDFVVNSAINLAEVIGISEKNISLIIISVATILPELIIYVMATKKGKVDMAIGNIIGSCIFNILLVIGVSASIFPISYSVSYNKDFIILILATLLLCLFSFIGKKDELTRSNGIIFLVAYIIYVTSVCLITI